MQASQNLDRTFTIAIAAVVATFGVAWAANTPSAPAKQAAAPQATEAPYKVVVTAQRLPQHIQQVAGTEAPWRAGRSI